MRAETDFGPPPRIGSGVTEHVEEEGLGEGVKLNKGGATLGAQRVRLVEDLGDPSLLGNRREWKRQTKTALKVQVRDVRRLLTEASNGRLNTRRCKPVIEIAR